MMSSFAYSMTVNVVPKVKQETHHEIRIAERDIFLNLRHRTHLYPKCELPCSNNITDKLGVQKLMVGLLA